MDITLIIYLLFVHWIADFVMQSDEMAKEKSSNNIMLAYHCIFYGVFFAGFTLNITYGVVLGLIHFPVDYITSRINKHLYAKGDIHNFFVSIGFDQFLHFTTIILIAKYFNLYMLIGK